MQFYSTTTFNYSLYYSIDSFSVASFNGENIKKDFNIYAKNNLLFPLD